MDIGQLRPARGVGLVGKPRIGKIVEAGTFDELVQAGGRFASLARTQLISAEPVAVPTAAAQTPEPV